MTDQSSPITPPPELVINWCKQRACISKPGPIHTWLANRAAQWGADQQLEALLSWLRVKGFDSLADDLLTARRPKPPSEADQALGVLAGLEKRCDLQCNLNTIRCALERLKKLEESTND